MMLRNQKHSTARLAPVEPPYENGVAETLDRMAKGPDGESLKLFRTLAHHPAMLDRFRAVGATMLGHGLLDPREREIVIHRTTARCGSDYEFAVHVVAYGRALGFGDEHLESLRSGAAGDPVWPEREALLIRLCDELHDTATVSDELWAALAAEWTPAQLVELLCLAGFYHLVSYVTNAPRVEAEEWAPLR